MVYLIHLESKLKHSQHYLGFVDGDTKAKLDARVKKHLNGSGARFLRAANIAGIKWEVVRVWKEGDRTFERSLKNQKKSRCLCPECSPKQKVNRYKVRKRATKKAIE